MGIIIDKSAPWYHGSNKQFTVLNAGSTITQWRELAEAFSHKPNMLCCEDDGHIWHNGTEDGFLYLIDEPVVAGRDATPHPRTTMDENAEFLTARPLRVKLIQTLPAEPIAKYNVPV